MRRESPPPISSSWADSHLACLSSSAQCSSRTPPCSPAFWRFLLAAVIALACVARRPRPRAAIRDGLVLGSILALGMSLQVVGQAETTASKAAFLTGLAVVLTPFVAVWRTRRSPTLENGIGLTLASFGFLLLTLPAAGG